jgi:hypothetical protein
MTDAPRLRLVTRNTYRAVSHQYKPTQHSITYPSYTPEDEPYVREDDEAHEAKTQLAGEGCDIFELDFNRGDKREDVCQEICD